MVVCLQNCPGKYTNLLSSCVSIMALKFMGAVQKRRYKHVQDLWNKLLKLLLRLYLLTSTSSCHNKTKIIKKHFVKRNTPHNTRQVGQLDYCRVQIELGTSWVQYHVAKPGNILNLCHKEYTVAKWTWKDVVRKHLHDIHWLPLNL